MAIDLTTNRRGTSLTGVGDATGLAEYFVAGVQETYRMANKMSQFFIDVSDTMRNVQSARIYRNRTSLDIKTDLKASGNALRYSTTGRGSPTLDYVTIAWADYYAEVTADLTQQQMREHPIDLLTTLAVARGITLAEATDTYLEHCLAGDLPSTYPSAERTLWANILDSVDNLDGTTSTDHLAFLGTSTSFIPMDGREEGDAKIVLTLLDDLELKFEQENLAGNASIAQTRWRVIMPPHLFKSLELSIDTRAQDRFFVQRLDGGEKRGYFGIFEIVSSNRLKERRVSESSNKVVQSGGKKAYPIYLLTPSFGRAASRDGTLGLFPPGVNQDGAFWSINYTEQYQAWPIDPRTFEKRWVPSEARS